MVAIIYRVTIVLWSVVVAACGGTMGKGQINKLESSATQGQATVTLTQPLDGATIKGIVALQAESTVPLASVTFRWDSVDFDAPDTAAPFSYTWNTAADKDGFYTLTALAVDQNGNQLLSTPITVRVVNIAPVNPPPPGPPPVGGGTMRRVPQDYPTIQAAINAAANGDSVLLSPGTYPGGFSIAGKSLTIASLYLTTGQLSYVDQTRIANGNPMITIAASAANTRVIGLSFIEGSYAISLEGYGEVLNCKFTGIGADSVSFEGAGGVVRDNEFVDPSDDAVDADGPMTLLIENNRISGAGDDGIEIRNFNYAGPLQTVTIRSNRIEDSEEDGIQLIDYSANSSRRFVIERNLILNSADAGIGVMDDGETTEDFRAASIPERIHILNNTISGNKVGVSGGDNTIMVNNIVTRSTVTGLKGVDGGSIVRHTLFFGNASNFQSSNVDAATTLNGDPLLGADFRLGLGSPAVDKGVRSFQFGGEMILNIPLGSIMGLAPDLGAMESR